ncbi:hypothetical protein [Singulisphaera sp. PoT]|uniref:hypothetical protein n=1 Tax=Singulisphaera sp. PoT TaxID=3411797 RepID=UPI003BF470CD
MPVEHGRLAPRALARAVAIRHAPVITYYPGWRNRPADWTAWEETGVYDWIIGADILYGESLHPHLRHIFDTKLAEGGRLLISDPFRTMSLRLMEAMEAEGWDVRFNKWEIGLENVTRPVGVFQLIRTTAQSTTDSDA